MPPLCTDQDAGGAGQGRSECEGPLGPDPPRGGNKEQRQQACGIPALKNLVIVFQKSKWSSFLGLSWCSLLEGPVVGPAVLALLCLKYLSSCPAELFTTPPQDGCLQARSVSKLAANDFEADNEQCSKACAKCCNHVQHRSSQNTLAGALKCCSANCSKRVVWQHGGHI